MFFSGTCHKDSIYILVKNLRLSIWLQGKNANKMYQNYSRNIYTFFWLNFILFCYVLLSVRRRPLFYRGGRIASVWGRIKAINLKYDFHHLRLSFTDICFCNNSSEVWASNIYRCHVLTSYELLGKPCLVKCIAHF